MKRGIFTASLRKKVSHKGPKALSIKMRRIFLCALETLWLKSALAKTDF